MTITLIVGVHGVVSSGQCSRRLGDPEIVLESGGKMLSNVIPTKKGPSVSRD
jgi:hypothetical protein